jgi:hypothetical protein
MKGGALRLVGNGNLDEPAFKSRSQVQLSEIGQAFELERILQLLSGYVCLAGFQEPHDLRGQRGDWLRRRSAGMIEVKSAKKYDYDQDLLFRTI